MLALAEYCVPEALLSTVTGQGTARSHRFTYGTAKTLHRITWLIRQ